MQAHITEPPFSIEIARQIVRKATALTKSKSLLKIYQSSKCHIKSLPLNNLVEVIAKN